MSANSIIIIIVPFSFPILKIDRNSVQVFFKYLLSYFAGYDWCSVFGIHTMFPLTVEQKIPGKRIHLSKERYFMKTLRSKRKLMN